MNHLYINNKSVDFLGDLKSLMDNFRVAKDDDPLFIDLIDNFVDGNIEVFLEAIGEHELAKRIKTIDTANGDSQIRQELIKAVCDVVDNIKIDPYQFFSVEKAVVDDNKAFLEVKVIKKAVEKFNLEISVPPILQSESKVVNLKDYHIGEIISVEMVLPEHQDEYEVDFVIGNKVVKKEFIGNYRRFSISGVVFRMIRVDGGEMGTYYIGETQVTQALWKAAIEEYYKDTKKIYLDKDPSRFKGPNRPVELVSWNECNIFVSILNIILSSQLPKGFRFALPTDAQWEYAAKGGMKSKGYQYSGCDKENELEKYAWYNKNAYYCGASTINNNHPNYGTHDVKTKKPNELKIYDMNGNVWEWCEDLSPSSGSYRVLRGSCWSGSPETCRVTYRYENYPDAHLDLIGFRLALVNIWPFGAKF